MRSLRSRLIVGMLLGMAVLLVSANMILYAVQRRQLYRAFDDTVLSSANALVLLIHHGSPDFWFDFEELANLPAGRIHHGALFQFWSSYPISVSSSRNRPGPGGGEPPPPRPRPDDSDPPDEFRGRNEPPGARRGPPRDRPGQRRGDPTDDPDGGVYVIRSPLLVDADLPRIQALAGQPRFEQITLPDGSRGRAVGLEMRWPVLERAPRRSSASAQVTAVVAASTADIERQLSFLAGLLAVTALGTMTVSGGVTWLVVSHGLHPLAAVARRMAAMDETGLKQRIESQGVPQEITPVVHQLNGLLSRLDEAFERERALTADVAHELRTPVAELRTITEITLSRLREPDEYRQALGETLETIRTLQGLIEKLLVLARLEAGEVKPELDTIALQPVLAQQWVQVRGDAERRGLVYEDRCSADAVVAADPRLLDAVLSNALSNAVAYTPDGGRVIAEAHCTGRTWTLTVENTGCQLARDDAVKVFDRFWRADVARSGGTALHCGLGLPLVRRAMEIIGGTAEAHVTDDRHFVLTLAFKAEIDIPVQDSE